jgi:hypothetical protein
MAFTATTANRPVRQTWVTLVLGIVFFIILPVVVTMLIPATWVTLTRSDTGRVSATAHTCVLFVVPWRSQQVAGVTAVESNMIRSDKLVRTRPHGSTHDSNRRYSHSDGEAELRLQGNEGGLTVKISPASVDEVKAKAQAFLQDLSQRQTRFFVIANWKFGLGFGIPLTLLALLYVVGSALAILRALFRKIRPGNPA